MFVPSETCHQTDGTTCTWSAGAESTLPFYDLMKDESTENKYYTNKDMLRMFHPDNKALPHIYDSLEYNHCTGDLSDNDDVDVQHADFRTNLMSSVRKKTLPYTRTFKLINRVQCVYKKSDIFRVVLMCRYYVKLISGGN